jgi:hypothetical protein
MKRDILNYLGEKIGEMELPDSTPEKVWVKKLLAYAQPPTKPVISDVNPRQIRSALVYMGIFEEKVRSAFSKLPEPNRSLALIGWEYSVTYKRNDPLVDYLGNEFGFDSEWLDNLWITAASL